MGADKPSHSHSEMEVEVEREAELPSGTVFAKKRILFAFFVNQQNPARSQSHNGFTLRGGTAC